MVAFIDHHRDTYGVEPICAVLPIAPSTYFLWKAQQHDPTTRSARHRRDDDLRAAIQRVWTTTSRSTGRGRCGSSFDGRGRLSPGAPSSA